MIDTAIVLVGGEGNRLKPLTNGIPKAMVQVKGKPLIEWIIRWLKENNVRTVILGVAYLKEKIMDYFGDGSEFGVKILYSNHSVEGGTSEGFRLAINRFIDSESFYAMNGDQITDLKLSDLASFHLRHNYVATMAVFHPQCCFGHINVNDKGEITHFFEKKMCSHVLCNTGIYVFNKRIIDYLPEKGDIEKTAFPELAKDHLLKAYPFNGAFLTINTYKDWMAAEKSIRKN